MNRCTPPSPFAKMRANREKFGLYVPEHRRRLIAHIEQLRDELDAEMEAQHGPLQLEAEEEPQLARTPAPSPAARDRYMGVLAQAVAEEQSCRRRRWWAFWWSR